MYYIAKEGNEVIFFDSTDKTCEISFFPVLHCVNEKIAICPKVLRKDGKQFKVTRLDIPTCQCGNLEEIRVPGGVYVSGAAFVKITRY